MGKRVPDVPREEISSLIEELGHMTVLGLSECMLLVHYLYPSTWEAESKIAVSLRPAWAT